MSIQLIKSHAFGNDFLLASADAVRGLDLPDFTRRVCDRHLGVGADGLMVLDETDTGADTQLFNADGGRAEVSGNGVRCAAAWLARARSIRIGDVIVIGTAAGQKSLTLLEASGRRYTFRAAMGSPQDVRVEELDVDGDRISAVVLNMGNPQCVLLETPTEARLHSVGARLAVHPFFPHGTNVELAGIEAPDRIRILIWERGVGPTQASGTGACASAVAAAFAGGAQRSVDVISPGGAQHVEWTSETVWLTGWADVVANVDWWADEA